MTTRSELYRYFGPIQTEARDLVFLRMINTLRHDQGLPEITVQEFRELLLNDTTHLPPYDWMNAPPP